MIQSREDLMKTDSQGASFEGAFLKKEKDPALIETQWEKEVRTEYLA